MLKRARIGMLPGGVNAAQPGSCAVECPACPRHLPRKQKPDPPSSAPENSDEMPMLLDAVDSDDEDDEDKE